MDACEPECPKRKSDQPMRPHALHNSWRPVAGQSTNPWPSIKTTTSTEAVRASGKVANLGANLARWVCVHRIWLPMKFACSPKTNPMWIATPCCNRTRSTLRHCDPARRTGGASREGRLSPKLYPNFRQTLAKNHPI